MTGGLVVPLVGNKDNKGTMNINLSLTVIRGLPDSLERLRIADSRPGPSSCSTPDQPAPAGYKSQPSQAAHHAQSGSQVLGSLQLLVTSCRFRQL